MGLGRDILYGIGAVASSPVWGLSLLRTGKWRTDWAGRFGKVDAEHQGGPHPGPLPRGEGDGTKRLLIHAVSVGEVNLLRPMVAIFEDEFPGVELVIAATTNTGFARARQLFAGRHAVVRYPLDFSFAVGRFLDSVRPDVVATVELEVWPNFVEACVKRGVPVCVINGRLSERSFRGYKRFGPVIGPTFGKLTVAAAQTGAYAERFRHMGVRDVRVYDTMKWDAAQVSDAVDGADALAAEMGIDRSKPLIVAGSTAPGEEKLLVDGLPEGVQLLVAPRKPEWFDGVAANMPGCVRRTSAAANPKSEIRNPKSTLFLLDTIGELRMAYSLCDVAVVGRSFLGLYGSDVMEPAALGKPVIIGPHYDDFADTVEAMRDAGGLAVTDQPLAEALRLLGDREAAAALAEAGRAVILSRQGSARRHVELLMTLLNKESRDAGNADETVEA